MGIRLLLLITYTISFSNFVYAQDQSFKLKDGTIILGTIQEETDLTMQVQTKFGIVTINKNELIQTRYEVKLISGETLVGIKIAEDTESIVLKTQMGELMIQRSDIINIQEVDQKITSSSSNTKRQYRRTYGLADLLFGGSTIDKDTDFTLGEEQLIDLFFDPTAYTLEKSTLYLSGLSFGFGVTEKFQITTKWGGFFYGNMNLRPKLQLFEKGNWENQQSFSIGAHYHTRWSPNKYEWKSGSITINNEEEKYWGGYYRIGENPQYIIENDEYINRIDEEEEYLVMIELFGAYTFSKARADLKGRISHTLGGNMQYISIDDEPTVLYRAYYGLDVDINSKLKMIGELFYDPYFIELWQQFEFENNYWDLEELSDSPVAQPDNYSPIHLDFGFIYALNESFRFGIHFQRPFVAFYWKF